MENEKELLEGEELVTPGDTQQSAQIPGVPTSSGTETNGTTVDDAPLSQEEPQESTADHDYSTWNKKELLDALKVLSKEEDIRKVDGPAREIKNAYDEIREREKLLALQAFVKAGGIEADFEFRGDPLDVAFEATQRVIRDRKAQYMRSQDDLKVDNLRKKTELLERLRALVDSDDTEHGFHQFKELQKQWKAIGPVPNAQAKTTWANYTALVDRFYDARSIYFELKELDRKKNLEAKLELCVRAEKLLGVEKLKDAVRELNELHHEFKHIGPVPKDEQEIVWQRFKAASDAVYAKRDSFLDDLNKQQVKNLDEKLKIAEEVAAFADFQTDRIKEWNQKTQEILALQKKWETVGAVARSKAKDVNKKFWSGFKTFFSRKSVFFRKLDEERDKNLKAKQELIRRAHELKANTDWDKTANALKDLQREWKEIGPVPEKLREKIFQEFKEACDFFFEQRRGQISKAENDQERNLQEKDAICAEMEQLAESKTGTAAQLHALVAKYNALGFVPKNKISDSKARFKTAVDRLVASLDVPASEKDKLQIEVQIGNLKNDPQADQKIYQKEQTIRKKVTKLENDIALLRNNLEFFGRSKNADKLREDVNRQIDEYVEQVKALKGQLKVLRQV
jgi:hypothetical protein